MTIDGLRRKTRAWARRHSYSFFSSLGALLKHRLGTLMTVLVLGIGILLPLGLFITLANLEQLDLRQEDWGSVTVFLETPTETSIAHRMPARVGDRSDVAEVQVISPQQGMTEFRETSGFGYSLELLQRKGEETFLQRMGRERNFSRPANKARWWWIRVMCSQAMKTMP